MGALLNGDQLARYEHLRMPMIHRLQCGITTTDSDRRLSGQRRLAAWIAGTYLRPRTKMDGCCVKTAVEA